jgi:Uma2 family endonuclease
MREDDARRWHEIGNSKTMMHSYCVPEPVTIRDYLAQLSDTRPTELVFGSIRGIQAPAAEELAAADRVCQVLAEHLSAGNSGEMFTAPVDVVLDFTKCLVVHPTAAVVLPDRKAILRDQIWGAPHMIVEMLSPRTAKRARLIKLRWYRYYGVNECWLVDPHERLVEVYHASAWKEPQIVREGVASSQVLPGFSVPIDRLFQPA